MHNPLIRKRFLAIRSILAFGLLLGLFISSGEGLRLFPIPTNQSVSDNARIHSQLSKITGYSYAAHGSTARHLKSKTFKTAVTAVIPANTGSPELRQTLHTSFSGTLSRSISFELPGEHRRSRVRAPPFA